MMNPQDAPSSSTDMRPGTLVVLACVLIAVASLGRLIPHAYNLTPVMGVAIFAAWLMPKRWMAAGIPLIAMIATNAVIGFYHPVVMLTVYAAFALPLLFRGWMRRKLGPASLLSTVLLSGLGFFLSTNFAVWLASPAYAKSVEGLIACFVAALPFYRNMLVGDLLWTAALFGAWALAHRTSLVPALVRSK